MYRYEGKYTTQQGKSTGTRICQSRFPFDASAPTEHPPPATLPSVGWESFALREQMPKESQKSWNRTPLQNQCRYRVIPIIQGVMRPPDPIQSDPALLEHSTPSSVSFCVHLLKSSHEELCRSLSIRKRALVNRHPLIILFKKNTHLRLFCTRINSQSTAALTPVLNKEMMLNRPKRN